MKIKVDLAAFKSLNQSQMEALAVSETDCEPEDIQSIQLSVYPSGYGVLRWRTLFYNGTLEIGGFQIESTESQKWQPVRWSTIELLAEYGVIKLEDQ